MVIGIIGITVIVVVAIASATYAQTMQARVEIAKAKEHTAHIKLLTARIDAAAREVDTSAIV